MARETRKDARPPLLAEWPLPPAASLGSAVRAKGIGQEIRARLPWPMRRFLEVETGRVVFGVPEEQRSGFEAASAVVARALTAIEALPVLPREVEDILTVTARERQKWTKDGRLQSAGTRTVKLRGRARTVTFHVFDPRHIEDVLDRDLPTLWREEDAQATAENRRRAAGKAALTRAGKGGKTGEAAGKPRRGKARTELKGWDAFDADGLLR